MERQILAQLEAAAKVILATSPTISNEDRNRAENVFLNFRKTQSPYSLCKYILETSKVDYVVFETANTLKEAIIREWDKLAAADVNTIREYLLHHINSNPGIAVFVREKILQVISIIIKRGSILDKGAERAKLLIEIEQFILSGNLHKQIIGCGLISALLQEYATTMKSSDVGLTWETHMKVKSQFEVTDLKIIFKLCLRMLGEISQIEGQFPENVLLLLKYFLQITETILTWNFVSSGLPKNRLQFLEGSYEADNAGPLRLTEHWEDIALCPGLVELFFHLHRKIRYYPHLTHYTLNCLVQLSTLTGPVVANREKNAEYTAHYLRCFMDFVSSIEVLDREACSISLITDKINVFRQSVLLYDIPKSLYVSFLQQLSRLTCHFAENAAKEAMFPSEDALFTEAFDNTLRAWVLVMGYMSDQIDPDYPVDLCRNISIHIVDSYLRWHLSPPHGNRMQPLEEVEVKEDDEEEDREKYHVQLQTVGMFSRQALDYFVPALTQLIEGKTAQLRTMYEQRNTNEKERNIVYDDLHWLLTISGYVLTYRDDGEPNNIPKQVIGYSKNCMHQTDIDKTWKLMCSLDSSNAEKTLLNTAADPVVRLVSAVLHLASFESNVMKCNMSSFLSPSVVSTVAWFLNAWSSCYIIPSDATPLQSNEPLWKLFVNPESESVKWVVNFLLEKIRINLRYFSGDTLVLSNTVDILEGLVNTKERALCAMKSNTYWEITNLYNGPESIKFSPTIKSSLGKVFILAGVGIPDEDMRRQYFSAVIESAKKRFHSIIHANNFQRVYHEDHVKNELIDCMDRFLGMARGSTSSSAEDLYNMLSPLFNEMVSLMELYHSYGQLVTVILEFFEHCSDTILHYISDQLATSFYESYIGIIDTYAKHNVGNVTIDPKAEDDVFQDAVIITTTVTNIVTKDAIDINQGQENGVVKKYVVPSDVCWHTLKALIPMLSLDLLQFPTLCSTYYTLINFACEMYPEKLCLQPHDFLVNILATIEVGLTLLDGAQLSAGFLSTMIGYFYRNSSNVTMDMYNLLRPFTKTVMTLILSNQVASDCTDHFAVALFGLICSYKDYYMELVNEIISQQPNEASTRLSREFQTLTEGVSLDFSRQEQELFKKRFETFLINTRSFLYVK